MEKQPDHPKHDPNKIFTNPHEAYMNWLLKKENYPEYERLRFIGTARKRAKEIDKKLKDQENDKPTI